MTGPQHKAMGVALAALAGPAVGLSLVSVLAGGVLVLLWPRRFAHQLLAGGLFVLIAHQLGAPPLALSLFLAVTILSALVPDFDHPFSTISRGFPPGHYAFRWTVSNPLTWLIGGRDRMRKLAQHRALSHTVWALAVWTVGVGGGVRALALAAMQQGTGTRVVGAMAESMPLWTRAWGAAPAQLGVFCAVAGGLGFASHIIADAMTRSKTRPLAPFSTWTFQMLPDRWLLTTGGRQKARAGTWAR